MFKKNIKNVNQKKGVSLVIAITTVTLLLSVSLSISNIVLRQIKISALNNSSKPAFFIADSAMECAFYYDTAFIADAASSTKNINDDFSTSLFGKAGEGDTDTTSFIKSKIKCGDYDALGYILNVKKEFSPDLVITTFDIAYDNSCANVMVERTEVDTKIIARGYNTKATESGCDLSNADSRRVVERGLTIKY